MTETKMQLVDWLDDLCVRFIVNLPQEELESVERICFQVEEAQWFYEDFIRPQDPSLPSLSLREFCLLIFQHCPLLSEFSTHQHSTAFSEFLDYKTRVPVRGAIMLNEAMDEVVLVKGWKKGANWSFPRGKINKDEKDLDCAIREVYEETGFDIRAANLVKKDEDVKSIEITMREQHMRLFVFRGVPLDTHFEPRTRKEISKIQWYKLSELPTLKRKKDHHEVTQNTLAVNANKFYMVAPFLVPLKKWITQQTKNDFLKDSGGGNAVPHINIESRGDEQNIMSNGEVNMSATGDMIRLMDKLRESSQPRNTNGFVKPLEPDITEQNTPAEITSFLHGSQPDTPNAPSTSKTVDLAKSNALLALLRKGKTGGTALPEHLPQTPLEQVQLHPPTPDSPKQPPTRRSPRLTEMPPPSPSYPFTSQRLQEITLDSRPQSLSHNQKPPLTEQLHPAVMHMRSAMKSNLSRNQHTSGSKSQQSDPDIAKSSVAPAKYHAPAPYRRTGDPEFVQQVQSRSDSLPAIPPANKLPPPKLTNHSSALLNIFKTGKPVEQTPPTSLNGLDRSSASVPQRQGPSSSLQSMPLQAIAPPKPRAKDSSIHGMSGLPATILRKSMVNKTSATLTQDLEESGQRPSNDGGQNSVQKPTDNIIGTPNSSTLTGNLQNQSSLARSQHQDRLLDLFRRPSLPTAEIVKEPQSLEPPASLVELSAIPSPSHSREHSKVPENSPMSFSRQASSNVKIAKRTPGPPQSVIKPAVSATVSGPLNVPHFETLRKKREHRTLDSHFKEHGASKESQVPPVTILARPAIGQQSMQIRPLSHVTTARDDGHSSKEASGALRTITAEDKNIAKPFQPQILRRPPQPHPKPQHDPFESMSGRLTPPGAEISEGEVTSLSQQSQAQPQAKHAPPPSQTRLSFDRRDSQPQAHKEALLSLFSKAPPVTSPTIHGPVDLVSPLSDKPTNVEGSKPGMPVSRIGSLSSVPGDGAIGSRSGRQGSVTTPVQREFLISYLNGIAQGSGR